LIILGRFIEKVQSERRRVKICEYAEKYMSRSASGFKAVLEITNRALNCSSAKERYRLMLVKSKTLNQLIGYEGRAAESTADKFLNEMW
jgi:hypothetical protein